MYINKVDISIEQRFTGRIRVGAASVSVGCITSMCTLFITSASTAHTVHNQCVHCVQRVDNQRVHTLNVHTVHNQCVLCILCTLCITSVRLSKRADA